MDKNTKIILAVLVVVVLLWWLNRPSTVSNRSSETFIQDSGDSEEIIPLHSEENEPSYYDSKTGTMMTSPDYIPSDIEPAWGQPAVNQTKYDSPMFANKVGAMEHATDLGKNTLAFDLCSPSCCADQYPVPFPLASDPEVCKNKKDFVPSSYMCNNNWQNSGCLCMTKDQSEMLATRGGNL
jgi:hypothetical protein